MIFSVFKTRQKECGGRLFFFINNFKFIYLFKFTPISGFLFCILKIPVTQSIHLYTQHKHTLFTTRKKLKKLSCKYQVQMLLKCQTSSFDDYCPIERFVFQIVFVYRSTRKALIEVIKRYKKIKWRLEKVKKNKN